jgi:hypothetical protein
MLGEWSGDCSEPCYDDNGGSTAVQHGAPEGCSLSELLMAVTQRRLGLISEPKHVQHSPQYHMATGKRERRTLTPSRRNWTPRAGATPTPEKKSA